MIDTERVWMRHHDLPDHDPLAAVRSQVPYLAAAGWFEVEAPPEPEPEPEPKKKPSPAGAKPKPTPKDATASQGGND
jgi:hypothetical protein